MYLLEQTSSTEEKRQTNNDRFGKHDTHKALELQTKYDGQHPQLYHGVKDIGKHLIVAEL